MISLLYRCYIYSLLEEKEEANNRKKRLSSERQPFFGGVFFNKKNHCSLLYNFSLKKAFLRGVIRKQHNSRNYSQSKAPFCHSYTKPIVKISKKTIIDQNPKNPILFKETAHGNKKVTSKSNMINKIETK